MQSETGLTSHGGGGILRHFPRRAAFLGERCPAAAAGGLYDNGVRRRPVRRSRELALGAAAAKEDGGGLYGNGARRGKPAVAQTADGNSAGQGRERF